MGSEQIVITDLGNEYYGISISRVQEIIRPGKVTSVPNCPHSIEGIISLRGEIVPVIDLGKRFSIEPSGGEGDRKFVVVNVSDTRIAFIVDAVTEVYTLNEEDIDSKPSGVGGIDTEFIKGVGKKNADLIILLDVEKIFGAEEIGEIKEMA